MMPKRWVHFVAVAAVVLMLAAMVMYVMSDDEEIQPGGSDLAPPVPAAP